MMELELDNQAEHDDNIPRVFESAGGFSPTIGIIGAVLGLIQVMQHLDDIARSAVHRRRFRRHNLRRGLREYFFPAGIGEIKMRMRQEQTRREMVLEGVISILEGMNPRMIETKLMGFFSQANKIADRKLAK